MDHEIKIKINGGDSRELLLAQLSDIGRFAYGRANPSFHRPTFSVKLPSQALEVHNGRIGTLHWGDDTLRLLINGVVSKDYGGDLWAINGRIADNEVDHVAFSEFGLPTNFEGEYDTRQRRGWIKLS